MKHKPERVSLRCSCGGSASGAITAAHAERFRAAWRSMHVGPGHEVEDRSAERRVDFQAEMDREYREILAGGAP